MASILCFGDSITQGFVDLEGGWTQRLRRRLDQDASFPVGEARMQPAPWSSDGESYGNDPIRTFNQVVGRVAADSGAALVDCFDEWLAMDYPALLHDGLHPNGAGHQLLADRIGEQLRRWL